MKNILLLSALVITNWVNAQNVNIPDANFKAALVGNNSINTNMDTEIQVSEAIAFTGGIDVSSQGISDLTGIEAFINITSLNCASNSLTSIDVSSNLALLILTVFDNQLTALDITQNTALFGLSAGKNQIPSLDVSQNTALTILGIQENLLTTLVVDQNTALNNLLCSNNQLTALDVSQNTDLASLSASDNQITDMDVSNNNALTFFQIHNNMLSTLNIANGNNTSLSINARNNPSLGCIQVDDVAYAEANYTSSADAGVGFATDCSLHVPDANFLAALLAHTPSIDGNGDGRIFAFEANDFTGTLDVSSASIVDFTGLEAFVNATGLNVSGNQATTLDVTSLVSLTSFDASSNQLTALDLRNGNNTSILSFDIRGNSNLLCVEVDDVGFANTNFTNKEVTTFYDTNCGLKFEDANFKTALLTNTPSIDVNGDGEIGAFEASSFSGAIDVSNQSISKVTEVSLFVNATSFVCDNNLIEFLDLSQNGSLTSISCANNKLTFLDASNGNNTNVNTASFDATGNTGLNCITVDNPTYSTANWTNIPAGTSFSTDCEVVIPDANFKAALVAHSPTIDTNGDMEIQFSEAQAYTGTITVTNKGIGDLAGIEAFANITGLIVSNNNLTSIDVSRNLNLTVLGIVRNNITAIDVSRNVALTSLIATDNKLSEIDISQNILLESFAAGNALSSAATGNRITELDLSNNPALTYVSMFKTTLNSLDISNGNNEILETFTVTQNPNLLCITVSDVAFMETNFGPGTHVDDGVSYSTNCPPPIPDANFRAALLAHSPIIDTNGNGLIEVDEGAALTGTLNVAGASISDLSGIELFPNVTGLDFSFNTNIGTVDLSAQTKLLTLNCASSELTSLDVSLMPDLETLIATGNQISSLDITNNGLIQELDIANNQLTSIDISQNPVLTDLDLSNNNLSLISLTQNTNLNQVNLSGNSINNLNLSQNVNLTRVDVLTNNLVTLDLSQNALLDYLDISGNNLTSVNFGSISSITTLRCRLNPLASLNISGLTSLTTLIADGCDIASLDVSSNTSLTHIEVGENLLTSLDVSQNILLEELEVYNNQLTSLDVSQNLMLQELNCTDNDLTSLNVGSIASLTMVECYGNQLSEVDVSGLPQLNTLSVENNQLISLDVSANSNLVSLDASDNQLLILDLANGNNANDVSYAATNNPNLTCITVDDVAFAEANFSDFDMGVTFSLNCPSVETDILSFVLTEQTGPASINSTNRTIQVEVAAGTDLRALTPTISLSVGATVSPESLTSQDFSSTVTYVVTAEDGMVTSNWDVTVTEALADPTDITLSESTIDENLSPNSLVGTFITEDASFSETHLYTFSGDDDKGAFTISGNQLLLNASADFETKNVFNVRVQTDDGNGGLFEKDFIITVNDVNEQPTALDLSNSNINESSPVGTVVGILSTTDVDAGDTHTYDYTVGCDACDPLSEEQPFLIVGNELRSNIIFDYETQTGYAIEVTSTDAGGLSIAESFVITIIDLPAQVTSLDLSNESINENENAGTAIGTFSTTGEDLSGNYTYTLVSGMGDVDNASFSVSGNQLLASSSFDFETKSSYSIRVMTDDGSLTREESFTINVNNVFEAPTDLSISETSITENNAVNAVIGSMTTIDEDAGESHTYSLVAGDGDTDNASFNINGNELRATDVFDFETKNSYSVRIETNDGNGGTYQEAFTISISNQNESISVANPIADQALEEGFVSVNIDLANAFSDEDGDALTYEVSSSNTSVVTVANTGTTLTISEVGLGTATIFVTADDGSGVTTTDQFEVTVSEIPLGFKNDISLEVYPNPTTSILNIKSSKVLNIDLTDLNGRRLKTGEGKELQMDLRDLSSGIYLLKITNEKSTTTRRIVKAN